MNEVEKMIRESLDKIPRIDLIGSQLPTPLGKMQNVTNFLGGPSLFIKGDDVIGGNKMRKLEFFIADAKQKGAHTVITFGAAQSNHGRETAVACNQAGLHTTLMLAGEEPKQHQYQGNLLLDKILGADLIMVDPSALQSLKGTAIEELEKAIEGTLPAKFKEEGYYIIPAGGYMPLGSVGYFLCAMEIYEQAKKIGASVDYIVTAVGTTGTYVGLLAGAQALNAIEGTNIKVIGVGVGGPVTGAIPGVIRRTIATGQMLGLDLQVSEKDITLSGDYWQPGYDISSKGDIEAIELVARKEGIFLDTVYTGKAMFGLLDMIKKKKFNKSDNIVFLHTGGFPALFAFNEDFGY